MNQQKKTVDVTLYLRGDALDPEQASQLLGVKPSKSQKKGEERVTSTNRKIVVKTGLWAFAAKSKTESISALVGELAFAIGDGVQNLPSIPGVQEAFLDIFMAIDAEPEGGGTCEFELSFNDLRLLERFGIPVKVTVTVVPA